MQSGQTLVVLEPDKSGVGWTAQKGMAVLSSNRPVQLHVKYTVTIISHELPDLVAEAILSGTGKYRAPGIMVEVTGNLNLPDGREMT